MARIVLNGAGIGVAAGMSLPDKKRSTQQEAVACPKASESTMLRMVRTGWRAAGAASGLRRRLAALAKHVRRKVTAEILRHLRGIYAHLETKVPRALLRFACCRTWHNRFMCAATTTPTRPCSSS